MWLQRLKEYESNTIHIISLPDALFFHIFSHTFLLHPEDISIRVQPQHHFWISLDMRNIMNKTIQIFILCTLFIYIYLYLLLYYISFVYNIFHSFIFLLSLLLENISFSLMFQDSYFSILYLVNFSLYLIRSYLFLILFCIYLNSFYYHILFPYYPSINHISSLLGYIMAYQTSSTVLEVTNKRLKCIFIPDMLGHFLSTSQLGPTVTTIRTPNLPFSSIEAYPYITLPISDSIM